MRHATDDVKVTSVKNNKQTSGRRLAPGVSVTQNGRVKRLNAPMLADKLNREGKISPRHKAPNLAPAESYSLYEDFEGWEKTDGTWTPEGWTVDMRAATDRINSWTPGMNDGQNYNSPNGQYFYAINYSENFLDEWLVSPLTEVAEGYQLSFLAYIDPTYLFSLDNIDWDELEFIGDKVVAATLQVWVQPEGGEWTMLHDFADDYKNMTLKELYAVTTYQFEPRTVSLEDYTGKKVKLGFRYTGTDGNTICIDAVTVGYPNLEDVSYMGPFSTLYWGTDFKPTIGYLTQDVAQYPVYSPITWENYTFNDEATYTWTYIDPVSDEEATSNDPDKLTLTYLPKFSGDKPRPNNLYTPPVLTATAPMAAPGIYSAPYAYFQAGGKFLTSLSPTEGFEGTLFTFMLNKLDLTFTTLDDPTIGDPAIPVFGHNANTDTYWLNYSLNDETGNEGDSADLIGIANMLMPSEAPMVVNGVTLNAFGKISNDAELTATIWALDAEMNADYTTYTKIGEAKLKGADISKEYDDGDLGYMHLNFKFDEPVILQATAEHPAYFVEISGFNSDKVEYFAPLQSKNEDEMCWGYIHRYIDLTSHGFESAYHSFVPMVYKENGDYVDLYGSFAIGLDAEYPWLSTDCKGIDLKEGKQEIPLNSYYDNTKLTVTAPEGLSATITGRYDQCKLTVEQTDFSKEFNDNITVKGPGVEVTIPVTGKSGISTITAEGAAVMSLCDLNGRVVKAEGAAPGVYVAKYSDGTVRKIVMK